ncbi:barstar family protein [Devosia ginsengisoli]|uniref:Ribonuclease inhibitor n=1 Tax=Devosia ginsengisoli TaxID=400770 RepID=A0A5B8LQX7_9HYPH|nr:barstar family protein [Devosia ginsengisoli]QDZ10486.1 ribonuclease inhibitor [Devosia ginsengisoli]
MPKTLVIEGSRVHDIPSFYDEINRVFMADADWKLGPSLDALDDLLYGGFGVLHGEPTITLVWNAFETCREALGRGTTRAYYLKKLAEPSRYNVERIKSDLAALEAGTGPTYFEIVLQIIAEHPNIALQAR